MGGCKEYNQRKRNDCIAQLIAMTVETEQNNNNNDEERRRRDREEAMERLMLAQETAEDNDIEDNHHDRVGVGDPARQQHLPQQQLQVPPAPGGDDAPDGADLVNALAAAEQRDGALIPQQQHHPVGAVEEIYYPPVYKRFTYTQMSFLAFGALLYYAMRTRQQWYLAAIYLSSSKWAYLIAGNACIASAVLVFDFATTKLLQGGLRVQEAEGLQDFFRWNVTETCLALTMFRSELTVTTSIYFVALILVKCLHHVANMREAHLRMTQEAVVESELNPAVPAIPRQHCKLLAFLVILQIVDLWAVQYTGLDLIANGPSVSMLFAFEAAILLVSAWSHLLLWHLHCIDGLLHFGHEKGFRLISSCIHLWKEYKATLTFAVELQAQAIEFLFYVSFFAIVLTYYGMPINLFREAYLSFTQLKERLFAFWKYRRLMASMDRFAAVTDEELDNQGRTCIICRDEMTVQDSKKLPGCGHVFHKSCLREWLVQQQSCPTCRADIATMQAQETARQAGAAAAAAREEEDQQQQQDEQEQLEQNDAPATPPTSEHEATIRGQNASATTAVKMKHEAVGFSEDPAVRPRDASATATMEFPAIYRVVQDATVWSDLSIINRTIPAGVLVFCTEIQKRTIEGAESSFLRLPDGWILESSVLRAHTLGHLGGNGKKPSAAKVMVK